MRSILLLPLVARCQETVDVCIWRMFVFMSVVVTVWTYVGMFVVLRQLLKIVLFSLGVLKYVMCLCRGCDGCCVFCLYCEAWSCRCSCMGILNVSSYRCCMFVSCVHPVAVQCCVPHNLQFINVGKKCKRRPYGRDILQSPSHNCLVGSHEYLLLVLVCVDVMVMSSVSAMT